MASRVQTSLKGVPLIQTCAAAGVVLCVFVSLQCLRTKTCQGREAHSSDSSSLLPQKWLWRTLSAPAYRKKLNQSQTGGALIITKQQQPFYTLLHVQVAEKTEWRAGGMTADWGSAAELEVLERVDQSKRSRPLAFKWDIWTQVGENVRAQIQFPSHRRHRVSVRGRLGQWLHQHFGVSCASLSSPPLGLYIWKKCHVF